MLDLSLIGFATAFIAGTASFLSPCVLPLVPGYLSYIAGGSGTSAADARALRWRMLGLAACFVVGFSSVFVVFGASITALSRLLLSYRYELNLAAGAIIALAGFMLLGVLRLPAWAQLYYRFDPAGQGSPGSALVLGLAFGFGWTPCIGPILASILALGAASASVGQGVALLAVYALGLGVPFLAAAWFMSPFLRRMQALKRAGRILRILTGLILIVMGWAIATGQLARFAIWMLLTFPGLGRLG
ncbi:cytochrome c biogenesis CcdA family protein [Achromobacter spanius]|uniref:Cytochrome C biogenesis protein n=1 Tax=Achromobacter spanius TaxID=217203 RepID=A0AAW3HX59_9BURK|nr:cytochrome c biogenesis protein CcdA [Achromobacter spanius]KNE23126.1 cytochrome C biogenesis protein [Achromobacter spanius]